METFPEDPFETVKTRIVGDDERQVVRVLEGEGRVMKTTEQLFVNERGWVLTGSEGCSEI